MALLKNPRVNLRAKYQRVFEISLVISLTFLIAAFKFFPRIESKGILRETPPEIINVTDIQQTRQEIKHPVPPRPSILIETRIDEGFIDIDFGTTDLDPNALMDDPPPLQKDVHIIIENEPFYDIAEEMPEPVGGIRAIQSKIIYPEFAVRAEIQGKVYVLAYVDENGDVVNTEITKGVGGGLDEAALNAVKSTKFKPGKQRGRPVKVKITIPVIFKLH